MATKKTSAIKDPGVGKRALVAPAVNFNPGGAYQVPSRLWQGIASMERAPGGRLWATWYSGGRGECEMNYVILATSGDGGETWVDPVLVVDPSWNVRAYDPVLWVDPDGRLWLFWAQSESGKRRLFDGRAGVWAIHTDNPDDEQPKWSAPRRLCDGIMMNKPTALSTGEWMAPVAVWSNIPPLVHDLGSQRFSNVQVSTDKGETWELRGSADVTNRGYDEHMIVERRDGSLWMLVRCLDGIGEAVSSDGGRTWKESPGPILEGPSTRFFIRRLKSGALLLVYHFDTKERLDLQARLSFDDGKTWQGGLILDRGKKTSYPDGVECPDGSILIIRDHGRHSEKEVLMAKFNEDDIMRSRFYSLGSWPWNLVSKIP